MFGSALQLPITTQPSQFGVLYCIDGYFLYKMRLTSDQRGTTIHTSSRSFFWRVQRYVADLLELGFKGRSQLRVIDN